MALSTEGYRADIEAIAAISGISADVPFIFQLPTIYFRIVSPFTVEIRILRCPMPVFASQRQVYPLIATALPPKAARKYGRRPDLSGYLGS